MTRFGGTLAISRVLALLIASLLFDSLAASPVPPVPAAPIFVLVGDSTVTETDGWGRGFRQLTIHGDTLANAAVNGRSSKSYLDEGRWKDALALKGRYYLIQFGHNDEPGKGADRETDAATTFRANLKRYVADVRAIGATPILVTSLTRRQFDAAGKIKTSQGPYVVATRAVAAAERVLLIDLNATSTALAERMGAAALEPLSKRTDAGAVDTTHLNEAGSLVFARLVIDELTVKVPALQGAFADAIVDAAGQGQYATVQDAINAVPQTTTAARRWTIYVRAGKYRELVYVQREKRFVSLVGEDPARTVITYDLNATMPGADGKPMGTFKTPTVTIDADDFSAENLTIQNDAGPVGQALALRVDGDRAIFRNDRFLGWQDTILLDRGRHYFEDSFIAGHVDFIFGGATAFFERCHIHSWRDGYITAASTPREQPYGFVFADGHITGETANTKTYLGRPWRDFAQVAFLRMDMSTVVRPEGWHNWDKPEREKTTRYVEFGSTGPGAAHGAGRVSWTKSLTAAQAATYTVKNVLAGADLWDPLRVKAQPSERKANAAPLPTASDVGRAVGASVSTISWEQVLKQPDSWYVSAEAVRIAENVLRYQRHTGGWPKNTDMAVPQSATEQADLKRDQSLEDSTIDNGSTTTQMRLLARVYAGAREERFRVGFMQGLHYLLKAQYTNGGWPQYFPLRSDYSRHVTFNDDAMTNVMTLLRDVSSGAAPFGFIDAPTRAESAEAVERGRLMILKAQITVAGVLTGWCQQHDAVTLAPVKARAYEHPSISGKETVTILRYLMAIDRPDAATRAAIEAGVAWLRKVTINGIRVAQVPMADAPKGYDVVMQPDPAAPALWARFYEIGTNRPIYSGRDSVIKYSLAEIELERRVGYSWVGPYATTLLATDYPAWQKRVG